MEARETKLCKTKLAPASPRRETAALVLRNITQEFPSGNSNLRILHDASLTIARGEQVVLRAPSGSGKSSVLHIAALLSRAVSGSVILQGETVDATRRDFEAQASVLRGKHIGFIYQFHHLLDEFSALENVMLAQLIVNIPREEASKRSLELLYRVGLRDRIHHRPYQLSGGERQRVAIARALANDPAILLADEPTGNLDAKLRLTVFEMMMDVAGKRSLLIATHDDTLAKKVKRRITIREQKLVPV